MVKFCGQGVYGAVAIGKVLVLGHPDMQIEKKEITNPTEEIARFQRAKESVNEELCFVYQKALEELGEVDAQIFEVHRMILEDVQYTDAIEKMIHHHSVNAEYAVAEVMNRYEAVFAAMNDDYMKERSADVRDISKRIIACLSETDKMVLPGNEKWIVCADDLTPGETFSLEKDKVLAFVTARGALNSHTAILAGSRGIPAIVAMGEEFLEVAKDGDTAIVDGHSGTLFLNPDEETLRAYEEAQKQESEERELLLSFKGKEDITKDGKRIHVCANAGSIEEVDLALQNDACGIGLFRSEFLYLKRDDYPTEEQQFLVYKEVLERMSGRPVIIRTLDIGADKQADYFMPEKEDNPALGLRGIRICLKHPAVFKTQLRALYRASVYGRLGILFPMIASVWEVEEVLKICEDVKKELSAEGVAYSEAVELGIMIETPGAAIISDRLAALVDFFSVGTNDLIQYTLACDRQNPGIRRFADSHHEAVLRLIEMTARNAHANGIRIGICGELAADVSMTECFLRMGIDELSVSPSFVLKVRGAVRSIDLSK